ncbi:MAG: aminotransferase class V-fold PLP-dependent enzyme [Bacteroidia bacterium]|nr:aminotransferase class V-fold PLP-dependent enzyme [Bacteroidia bacterium]
MNRRQFVSKTLKAGMIGGTSLVASQSLGKTIQAWKHSRPEEAALDESFWDEVRRAYQINGQFIYLNNGGSSPSSTIAFDDESHQREVARHAPSFFLWRSQIRQREQMRRALGSFLGCDSESIAILRNTTEALATVIQGLDLPSGSEVLTTDQDYPTVLHTLDLYARRRGWKVRKLQLPQPLGSWEDTVSLISNAFSDQTKFLLFSDVLFQTGERMPTQEICALARQRGIQVAVDGAHTVGHFQVSPAMLGCDYFASSLHKWLSAPLGTGMLWVNPEKIADLWPTIGAVEGQENDIRKFEHLGTRNLSTELAIRSAIDFDLQIGADRKLARLQFLTRYWWEQIQDLPGFTLKTNLSSPERYGALASFTCPSREERLDSYLLIERNIIIGHSSVGDEHLYRISPHVYTAPRDLDKLIEGIHAWLG